MAPVLLANHKEDPMSNLKTFFETAGASLGSTFYPKDYIFASFPSFGVAQAAAQKLRADGVASDSFTTASGEDAIKFFEEYKLEKGIWGFLVRGLSRAIDTEATFADADLERAREGAGFLAVHVPTDELAAQITEALKPFAPDSMQRYQNTGVESMV